MKPEKAKRLNRSLFEDRLIAVLDDISLSLTEIRERLNEISDDNYRRRISK